MSGPREVVSTFITFRPAVRDDVPAVADLFARSRSAALPFLPVLHSHEEDVQFFAGYLAKGSITLAMQDEQMIGFLATSPGWLDHLYLDPAARGRGLGQALVERARRNEEHLQLWCFADNHAARRFYERLDFRPVRETDGDNEEGLPDILYEWRRQHPVTS